MRRTNTYASFAFVLGGLIAVISLLASPADVWADRDDADNGTGSGRNVPVGAVNPIVMHTGQDNDVPQDSTIVDGGSEGDEGDIGAGDEFDPMWHEAMMRQVSEEVEPDHVVMTVQPGYRLGEMMIRPAKVIIAEGIVGEIEAVPDEDEDEGENDLGFVQE